MQSDLESVLCECLQRRSSDASPRCEVRSADPWHLDIWFSLADGEAYRIHSLQPGDGSAIHAFGSQLGPRSRWLFCPYAWANSALLDEQFARAMQLAADRIDASYLMMAQAKTIGHFWLAAVGEAGVEEAANARRPDPWVPELGIGIADAYHGRGLGGLAVRLLQVVGRDLGVDAIELTTHPENIAGYHTYLGAGFEQVGMLRIHAPASPDATTASDARRDERHMVYVINTAKRMAVLEHLARQRAEALLT
jgi:RimJ/RimL family protein N-acetyltransferase